MTIEEKLRLVIKNPITRANWLYFLKQLRKEVGSKEEYDSWDALKFLEAFQERSKGKSVRTAYNVLKRIYNIAGWEWDESKVRPPEVDDLEVRRPRLPDGMIEEMIENQHMLDPYRRGLFFISTIYGLRRKELVMIQTEDIDLEGCKILIRTGKHGVRRWQRLPKVAADALKEFEPRKVSLPKMSNIFHAIVYLTTGKPLEGSHGWHDIRRELAVRLSPPYTNLSDSEIQAFMRWKSGYGAGTILNEYRKAARESDLFEIDEKVLDQHPFRPMWEKVLWEK